MENLVFLFRTSFSELFIRGNLSLTIMDETKKNNEIGTVMQFHKINPLLSI